MMVELQLDGQSARLEFDTKAAVSTMSLRTFQKLLPKKKLLPTNPKLRTYTNEVIEPVGVCNVTVKHGNKSSRGDLYVIPLRVDSIMGREWIRTLDLSWADITCNKVSIDKKNTPPLNALLTEYADIFKDDVGDIPDFRFSLKLKDNTQPIFRRPRSVPYAIISKVEEEIKRLEAAGIIEKVSHSDWGTPVVHVVKPNGTIRLCVDYKSALTTSLR
uniref:Reverse transcriptase domain-containing protein n=1 Tax=Cuerna arida TaxID=1464854 RepID=A0A1B6GN85_9HEMI